MPVVAVGVDAGQAVGPVIGDFGALHMDEVVPVRLAMVPNAVYPEARSITQNGESVVLVSISYPTTRVRGEAMRAEDGAFRLHVLCSASDGCGASPHRIGHAPVAAAVLLMVGRRPFF